MTSSTAGHAFQVGTLPPSDASNGLPVAGSWWNHSALLYQSGSVLMIGPGFEGLSLSSQGLFATNLIFFVSTGGARAAESEPRFSRTASGTSNSEAGRRGARVPGSSDGIAAP